MVDTVSLWKPVECIEESRFMERLSKAIDKPTLHHSSEGHRYITGNILGMNVSASKNGINIKGSLCKSYLGDNFQTLTRQDGKRALEQLTDNLKIDLGTANVRRIDFANNFLMKHPPETYYPYLGSSQNFKRLQQPQSIYYQKGDTTKLFYNKIAEGKSKREIIPQIWLQKNVLRFELRYTSRLKKQFNTSLLMANNLFNEVFYIGLVDRWVKEYETINKISSIKLDTKNMKRPKDFFNQLLLQKINEIGQNRLLEEVEGMKAQNVFEHPEYYSRLKADIKRLCSNDLYTESSDLILELDKKIKLVKTSYR